MWKSSSSVPLMTERSFDIAYIALGSNIGDRAGYLTRARSAIAALPESRIIAESSIDETKPIGPVEQGAYLNQMIAVETALSPSDLLRELQMIEQREGRERTVRWGPRTLDLDTIKKEKLGVFGTPENTCSIFREYEKIGVTHIICMVNFGGVPMPDVRRTMELMSKEVFPQFR